jgi:hypothetical protein
VVMVIAGFQYRWMTKTRQECAPLGESHARSVRDRTGWHPNSIV